MTAGKSCSFILKIILGYTRVFLLQIKVEKKKHKLYLWYKCLHTYTWITDELIRSLFYKIVWNPKYNRLIRVMTYTGQTWLWLTYKHITEWLPYCCLVRMIKKSVEGRSCSKMGALNMWFSKAWMHCPGYRFPRKGDVWA